MREVILTCAVTGNITRPDQTPYLPVTPSQVVDACLQAAEAGAAIVHVHVRDPVTGAPSMEIDHYKLVVEQVRAANPDLILNVTTGPGGRFRPSPANPRVAAPGTTLLPPVDRVRHISALRPEIATLDLNTMNSGDDVVINTPATARVMGAAICAAGAIPEIELFDSGDIRLAIDLIAEGVLPSRSLFSIVLGIKYGFAADAATMLYARDRLPPDAIWTGFGVGRQAFPMVAQSFLLGGHVRIGMEDCIMLERGVLARDNAQLVCKTRRIVEDLGGGLMNAGDARQMLGLTR